ncbi:hypothetical protein NZK33_06320 [Cyanobium sp. FGCU-6]|nr:hypothetical protein [Cyanobium sp. FGCU6]
MTSFALDRSGCSSRPWRTEISAKVIQQALISNDGLIADGDWVESKDQDPEGKMRLLQLADIGDSVFWEKVPEICK